MGILDAYDKYGTPVITPDKVYDTKIRRADTCVVTFSHNVLEKVLDKFNHIVAGQIGSANGIADVYYLPEQDVLFFMSPIGAPAAGCILQEVQYLGDVKNFIYFGSCGLIGDISGDKVIICRRYTEISKSSMPSEEVIPGASPEFSAVNRRNWKSRPI